MLLRRVARPLMAGIFIYGGIQALRYPEGHTAVAKPVLDAVGPAVDKATEVAPIEQRPDNDMLVKVDAGVKIVGGSMFALNIFPRLAATALAASLVPTTAAGHRFWEEQDPAKRADQQVHFLKNLAMLGGLLIAAADTEGKPSLGWRGRRAARRAADTVSGQTLAAGGTAAELGGKLSGTAVDLGSKLTETAAELGDKAQEVGDRVGGAASDVPGKVSGLAAGLVGLAPGAAVSARASQVAEDVAARTAEARKQAEKRGAKLQKRAEKRRAALQKAADKRGAALQKATEKRRAELQKRAAERGAALQKAAERKWAELEKKSPGVLDEAAKLGHDIAERAATVRSEVVHQAEGVAKDARKRVASLTH